MQLILRDKKLEIDRTLVMGILNVTPDSFSDGGKFLGLDAAVARGLEMERQGADIIDIGGESTRPGSEPVTCEEEIRRTVPVIAALRKSGLKAAISIDTYKSLTAKEALDAGADMVNDVSAGLKEPGIMKETAIRGAGYVIMHMKGTPKDMQKDPSYSDKGVVSDILKFFEARVKAAENSGIRKESLVIDPGIGFGKTVTHNARILADTVEFVKMGLPVMVGVSRKSFIGAATGAGTDDRLAGTIAACVIAIAGGASIIRVHDVAEAVQAARVADMIKKEKAGG
ncbi:MAG TPA: dihydropteroate synthase [Candidatus Goldiibacteriota bacterium]|nr:dihydropteroate synthase [Candidatus Goldiibacteriota bacterium]